jgi:hypothetical protein
LSYCTYILSSKIVLSIWYNFFNISMYIIFITVKQINHAYLLRRRSEDIHVFSFSCYTSDRHIYVPFKWQRFSCNHCFRYLWITQNTTFFFFGKLNIIWYSFIHAYFCFISIVHWNGYRNDIVWKWKEI